MKRVNSILHTLITVSYGASFLSLFSIFIFSLTGFFVFNKNPLENIPKFNLTASVVNIQKEEVKDFKELIDENKIEAKSVIVIDVKNNNKTLFEKDSETTMPLASLTKLMTALIAYELLDSHQMIIPNEYDLLTDGEYGIEIGDSFLRDNAIQFMLVSSSNDIATAIARTTGNISGKEIDNKSSVDWFVQKMNHRAKELGLTSMSFKNPSGLDENLETTVSSKSSAQDIAKLYLYILENYPRLLDLSTKNQITIKSLNGKDFVLKNTNPYLSDLYQPFGSKTGFTNLAGGNLGVVINTDLNRPYIIVVLGSTKEGRFNDVKLIQDTIIEYQKQF